MKTKLRDKSNSYSTKDQELEKMVKELKAKLYDKSNSNNNFYNNYNNYINNNIQIRNDNNLPDGEKLVAVKFISVDQNINFTVICSNSTPFYVVEGELYKKYPEYKKGDNYFMFNGTKINRWETLDFNGINGYIITFNKILD